MSDEIIDVETVEEKVVRCPRCGQRNRLYRQKRGRSAYRCAKCHASLPNPFNRLADLRQWRPSKKVLIRSGYALGVLLVLAMLGWKIHKWRRTTAGLASDASPTEVAAGPPVSGTVLLAPLHAGTGELTIEDSLDCDACVKLTTADKVGENRESILFYVQKHRAATLRGIPEEPFHVMFETGGAWDGLLQTFSQDDLYFQFDKDLDFSKKNTTRELTLGKLTPDQPRFSPITKVDYTQ